MTPDEKAKEFLGSCPTHMDVSCDACRAAIAGLIKSLVALVCPAPVQRFNTQSGSGFDLLPLTVSCKGGCDGTEPLVETADGVSCLDHLNINPSE